MLVAPESLQSFILEHCHDNPEAGHMEMNKTAERVRCYAVCYKMIESCLIYVNSKKKHHVSYHAGSPLEKVHIDILGPLVEIPRGNQYVFVVADEQNNFADTTMFSLGPADRLGSASGYCGYGNSFHC